MRRLGNKTSRGTRGPTPQIKIKAAAAERRVATPNPDLIVVRVGGSNKKALVSPKEQASGVLARVAEVMKKPGADRARVFTSTLGKPVFAYFVSSKDPTKVVREDAAGRQTLGRFVGGRFRSVPSASTD
jgi:hypothetical protein